MKLLLDECLPVDLRHSFPYHEAHSAEWAGLKGLKNGELLRSAEALGYDVLLTVDHGIPHQQSFAAGASPSSWSPARPTRSETCCHSYPRFTPH